VGWATRNIPAIPRPGPGHEEGRCIQSETDPGTSFSDEDAITSLYMDEGYLFFSVWSGRIEIETDTIVEVSKSGNWFQKNLSFLKFTKPDSVPREIRIIDLEMRISEGMPATINRVIIKGNTKTNEHVVRRNCVQAGWTFQQVRHYAVRKGARNAWPFQSREHCTESPPQSCGRNCGHRIQFSKKGPTISWSIRRLGGYGFVGTVGIVFSNFSIRNVLDLDAWRPVPTGDGQSLSVRAQSNGKYYQAYNLSFMEPWFGGKKPNNFSFSLYYNRYENYYSSKTAETADDFFKIYGASIGIERGWNGRMTFSYSLPELTTKGIIWTTGLISSSVRAFQIH